MVKEYASSGMNPSDDKHQVTSLSGFKKLNAV